MSIKHLDLTRVRAFEQAGFDFTPGMNLLVGVNGVGKTTVLDALRICLSKILPSVTASRSRPMPFDVEDIRAKAPAMTIRFVAELEGSEFELLVHKQRQRSVAHKAGEVRRQTLSTPDKETCTPRLSVLGETLKGAGPNALGVFFSTRRSLVSEAAPSTGSAAGGEASAYADALGSRELRLADEFLYGASGSDPLSKAKASQLKQSVCSRSGGRFVEFCVALRDALEEHIRYVEKVARKREFARRGAR